MKGSIDRWSLQAQIELFRRQFLQLENPNQMTWPSSEIVRRPELQAHVYNTMFRDGCLAYPPPDRYRLRVLKVLIKHFEKSITNPEEDEISDDLTACLAGLMSQPQIPEDTAAQQKDYVTYSLPRSSDIMDHGAVHQADSDLCAITILENRALLASSGTTGLRTWEAALHLATFLASEPAKDLVAGKRIIELGAGTGLISILCAKSLGAAHVLATDGSGDVVDTLEANIFLNGLNSYANIETAVLKWGHALIEDMLNGSEEKREFDLVVGADVTYDERSIIPLVTTIDQLFDRNANSKVLISATVRNERTIDSFCATCRKFPAPTFVSYANRAYRVSKNEHRDTACATISRGATTWILPSDFN